MLCLRFVADCICISIGAGRTVSGNRTFKNYHPSYKSDVRDKFLTFAKACYSEYSSENNDSLNLQSLSS